MRIINSRAHHRWKRRRRVLLLFYLALLVCSWGRVHIRGKAGNIDAHTPAGAEACLTPVTAADGRPLMIGWLRWKPSFLFPIAPKRLPLILIHGGPGEASDFSSLGPMLAADGREVYALDMPGFGRSTTYVNDYSILADARAVIAWMDAAHLPQAHVLGWSQGGGVAMHVADLAPGRVATLILLASIGPQETEGSRSHAFEHARYRIGDLLRRVAPWCVPHFGTITPAPPAFTRYFADSDQRPLGPLMARLRVPTLVLHGQRDFLVPAWAARVHAAAIPGAQLVLLPASHFVPFWPGGMKDRAAGVLRAFFLAAEGDPAAPAALDPAPSDPTVWKPASRPADALIALPWWVVAGVFTALSARRGPSSRWTVALGAAMVVTALADYGVVLVGLVAGSWTWLAAKALAAHRTPPPAGATAEWRERAARGAAWAGAMAVLRVDLRAEAGRAARALVGPRRLLFLAAAALTLMLHRPPMLVIALLVVSRIFHDPYHPWGWAGVAAGLYAARAAVGLLDHLLTIPGRRTLRTTAAGSVRFEFWPSWVIYPLLAPTFVRGAWKARHPLAFTACNPGIENGGGFLDESKHAIMHGLRHTGNPAVCVTFLIDQLATPEHRADRAAQLVEQGQGGLRWPVVLKPDSGYRGRSVRRVPSREAAAAYFEMMPGPALIQPLHHGPGEVGVVWARRCPSQPTPNILHPSAEGFLFSATLKQFPLLLGDGRRTVEELIWRHPRFRLQAPVFLERLAGRRLDVPAQHECITLAAAGNHCQGTLFRDGPELITPQLTLAIDAAASGFRGLGNRPGSLDMVRFDLRFQNESDLKAGRLDPNAIIEMNGTLGESTNIYDPDKPARWSLSVLSRQWTMLYELGAERTRAGHRPMSIVGFFAMLARHFWTRRGSSLAD